MKHTVLCIDCGTQSIRALIFDSGESAHQIQKGI